jgi:GNAT superfamily N-acetyltransferase
MALTMSTVLPEQSAAVGDIVYEAFKEVGERHGFEPAFETPEMAQLIVRLLAQTEGYESYLLLEDGRPVACNFGDERDAVIGVGPVSVSVAHQGRGYGRRVMEALLERAKEGRFASVRLLQAAYNMESFSLYHRLGFDVKDALASIRGRPPADEPVDGTIRLYTPADAEACDALHRDVWGFSRRHDIEFMANLSPTTVVERDGQIAGYLTHFPGAELFVTHGVARDERALRDLIVGASRATAGNLRISLPVSEAETLRWSMERCFRLVEIDTYMVYGDYEPPQGAWVPSPFY